MSKVTQGHTGEGVGRDSRPPQSAQLVCRGKRNTYNAGRNVLRVVKRWCQQDEEPNVQPHPSTFIPPQTGADPKKRLSFLTDKGMESAIKYINKKFPNIDFRGNIVSVRANLKYMSKHYDLILSSTDSIHDDSNYT